MAELLFSKERPKILSELFGNEKIKLDLQKRSKEDSLPTAILLTGITGTGKTTTERILSKTILCQSKDKDGNPCNKCEYCISVENEQNSNYYTVLNASNLTIDDVRQLEDIANTRAFSTSKRKIIVIDEFQELSNNPKAQKAILKILEKPSKHCYFILLAMDTSKIPDAVKNRCIWYNFKPLKMEEIATCLYSMCKKSGIEIDTDKSEVLLTIAENSGGSMRTAVSHLERVIGSELWTVKEVTEELELVSSKDMIESINYLFSGNPKALEIKYTKDTIERLRYMLGTIYKIKTGVNVESWQKSQLRGLNDFSLEDIQYALKTIFELNQYPYLTQDLIDFVLINILTNCIKNKVAVAESPKRRKVIG